MAYNTSVDVPLHHWTSTDSLSYPIVIAQEPNYQYPLRTGYDYHVRLCIRYTLGFPLTRIPASLYIQEMDQEQRRIKRRLQRLDIAPNVKDNEGRPLGDGWGSLYEYQELLPDLVIRFDHPGSYRFLIIPSFKEVPAGIDGIASIGIELLE